MPLDVLDAMALARDFLGDRTPPLPVTGGLLQHRKWSAKVTRQQETQADHNKSTWLHSHHLLTCLAATPSVERLYFQQLSESKGIQKEQGHSQVAPLPLGLSVPSLQASNILLLHGRLLLR